MCVTGHNKSQPIRFVTTMILFSHCIGGDIICWPILYIHGYLYFGSISLNPVTNEDIIRWWAKYRLILMIPCIFLSKHVVYRNL